MNTKSIILSSAAIVALGITAAFAGEGMKKADTDGDGFVTQDEFRAMHDARVAEHFARIDENADGLLSEDEMDAAHEKRMNAHRGKHKGKHGRKMDPAQMVERLDADGSGSLSLAEMEGKRMSPDADTFQAADTDSSGELDASELKAMMKARRAEHRAAKREFND